MNKLFNTLGISKQAFHQYLDRCLIKKQQEQYLLGIIYQIRTDHPTMGCRDMYYKIKPDFIGRDAFESLCKIHGFASKRRRNYRKTTDSSGVIRFDNLCEEFVPNNINQLWVSDITYFELNSRFYYLTFILDAYSRRILGYNASSRLKTSETTLPAIKMAIKNRLANIPKGMIFHSDGGGQYYDKDFLKLTKTLGIRNSMSKYPWQNPQAERINGVIKNNYLVHRHISSFEQLTKELDRSVKLYNHDKPHKSLNRKTPIKFENDIFELNRKPIPQKTSSKMTSNYIL